MRNLSVHWYEGMFLRPQHFQAADRHWSEWMTTALKWDTPYNYGIHRLEISREALANHQLQISDCEVRLRDGTQVTLEKGQEPSRVDLKAAFARNTEVTVYLAIPNLVMGRANVATGGASGTGQATGGADGGAANASGGLQRRYREVTFAVQDETTGGGEQSIQFRDPVVRVLLSTDDLSGYETLPIAKIKRASAEEATPEIDADYFPPVLSLEAWPALGRDTVRAIYDIIGQKMDVLSQRATERRLNLSSPQPGDLDDLLMLSTLNEASATLHCLAFAHGVHPFVAYTELCRIVGQLSLFESKRRLAQDIPHYDHEDLARIFRWIRIKIEQLLGTRRRVQYEQRYFVGAERGMQVALDANWFHAGWEWYVGVAAQNLSEAECRELLRPGKLDWKMGSVERVDLIFRHGLPGVERLELSQPPRELPPHGWVYYEITKQEAAWRDVLATQTLALRFKEELIGNLDKLRGQQKLEVVLPDKRAILEFALFAVPRHNPS